MASHGRRVLRHVTAVALCALFAHAVAYGSLVPEDGAHGYFTWYAPLVGVLSALSILVTLLALVIALVSGPASRLGVVIRSMLPTRSTDGSVFAELFRLAAAALVLLAVQESFERSLSAGRPELVSFAPSTLVFLVTAVLFAAAAIALIEHALSSLTDIVLRAARETGRKELPRRWRPAHLVPGARLRPLAVHGGLRAPPLLA
jgi:hypothetical protein